MAKLEWNEGLSVGVEAIDNDHKTLLSLINKVSHAIENRQEAAVIEDVFDQLEHYVIGHFSREEKLMHDSHYRDVQGHIKRHRQFTNKIPELKQALLDADSREAAEEINLFLFDWLMNHIIAEDMAFAQQVYDQGLSTGDNPSQIQISNSATTSWLTKILTLKQRIALTALIPTISILLLSSVIFWFNFKQVESVEQLLGITQIVEEVNTLTHSLQAERGLSTSLISSYYRQHQQALHQQRQTTDQAQQDFNSTVDQILHDYPGTQLQQKVMRVRDHIATLPSQRQSIDDKQSSSEQVLSFYAQLIDKLLAIPEQKIHLQLDPELARLITAYSAILHMKEAKGLQRALGTQAILQNDFSAEQYQNYAALLGEQRSFLKIFQQFTTEPQQAHWQSFLYGSQAKAALELEKRLLRARQQQKLDNLDSQHWFQVMTDQIGQLKTLADLLSTEIKHIASQQLQQLQQQFYLTTALLLLVLILSAGLSWLLNTSIISPIKSLTRAMVALARGDRKIRFIGHSTQDELKQMLDAYEQCRRSLLKLDISSLVSNRRQNLELKTRVRESERYRHLASTDPLTGAVNRRQFDNLSKQQIELAQQQDVPLSLLMLDLDHFKQVNDTYGHAIGDAVLKAFSQLCRDNIRKEDLFARLGGEEFAILLPKAPAQQAKSLANRICLACRQMKIIIPDTNEEVDITVSIGVTQWHNEAFETMDDMLAVADQALYRAKNDGRDRVCFQSP